MHKGYRPSCRVCDAAVHVQEEAEEGGEAYMGGQPLLQDGETCLSV